MATRTDWAFDVQEFFEQFAGPLGFEFDEKQNYPDRITGTLWSGTTADPHDQRAVVIPRPVGHDYANRYRRWVTLPPVHWENITNRPAGWRYFVLMVGLLPDGSPWWAALYDEQTLAQRRDHSENMGGFYRFDPGLTEAALVAEWSQEKGFSLVTRDSRTTYRATLGEGVVTGDQAEVIAAIFDWAAESAEPVTGRIDVDGPQMSFHFE